MAMYGYRLIMLSAFYFLTHINAEEPAKQYNAFAKKYSDVFVENNQNSITTYFRYLDMPLKGKNVLDLGCGDGYDLSQIKLKEAHVCGIDSSEEMVKLAQQKNPEGRLKV